MRYLLLTAVTIVTDSQTMSAPYQRRLAVRTHLPETRENYFSVSPGNFFNSLNDKHQHMHFTLNNILV